MVNEKRRRMDSISKQVMMSLDLVVTDPSEKNKTLYDNALAVYADVRDLPEWPFTGGNLISVAVGAVIPTALTITNLVITRVSPID